MDEPRISPTIKILLIALGFAALLGVGFFYAAAGLVVPGVYLFGLWAVWGALFMLSVIRRHDLRYVFGAPVVAAVVWVLVVFGLGSLLDWQP